VMCWWRDTSSLISPSESSLSRSIRYCWWLWSLVIFAFRCLRIVAFFSRG
jgi:hypothetical protein